ncbi:MAG TPA: hypothetical protein PLB88_02350 [Thermoanaerobaculaceae bacterium]|nr:hypothetical protein [Thermoanaerobaculaceae bacterium]
MKPLSNRIRLSAGTIGARHVLAALTVLLVAASAPGASHTWSGTNSGSWSDAGNWSAGGAPTNGETVDLTFPISATNYAMNNDVSNLTITSMTFNNTPYSLTGNAVTLNGVALYGGTTFTPVHVGVPITLAADLVTTVGNNLYLSLDGVISGSFGVQTNSVGGCGGYTYLTAANTYTGATTVNSGYLIVSNNQGLGTTTGGTTIANGGLIQLYGVTITGEALTLAGAGACGNGTIQASGGSADTWTGPVALTSNVVFTALTQALTIPGVISGGYGITFRTTDGVTLTADNTYSGPSTIEYGRVYVNGSQPSSSFSTTSGSGTRLLGGTGTVGAITGGSTGDLTVAPGPSVGTGVLACGNLALTGSTGVLSIQINGPTAGTNYDQLAVTGTVDITGATLAATIGGGYTPAAGTQFMIIANDGTDPVIGSFAGLAEGAVVSISGLDFSISYVGGTGNDVVLTAVNAPGPTPTPTPTPTATPTPTPTPTATPTATPTPAGAGPAIPAAGHGGLAIFIVVLAATALLFLARREG